MDFISLMEWIGTVAFAVSGALAAVEKGLDYYGICILALVTAVGGGIIRDIMINRDLPSSLENPVYLIVSIITAILLILFYEKVKKFSQLVNIADAIGLAAFVSVGSQVAVTESKGTVFVIITLAVLTGTGGGILRDIMAKEIPLCFREEVYASAAIAGAAAYAASYQSLGLIWASYISFGVTLLIRLAAIRRHWNLGKVKQGETVK